MCTLILAYLSSEISMQSKWKISKSNPSVSPPSVGLNLDSYSVEAQWKEKKKQKMKKKTV